MQRSGISETGRASLRAGHTFVSWLGVVSYLSLDAIHAAGEPPLTRLAPEEFADLLGEHGFEILEHLGYADVEPRWGLPALNIGNERVVLAVKRQ